MTNEYRTAELLELGTAKALVLGNKQAELVQDSITLQFGTRVVDEE